MILAKERKDFSIILFGKLLQVIIMVISIKILTSLLSPHEMGNIYIFTTVYTFFVLSLISPVGQYINRHTHKWEKDQSLLDNLGLYLLYLLIVSIFATVVGSILYFYGIANNMGLHIFLFLLFSFVLFVTLNQTILPMLNMLHYRLSFTTLTILTSLWVVIFGYFIINIFGCSAQNWLMGTVLSNIVFVFLGFIVLQFKIKDIFHGFAYNLKKISKDKLISILRFIIPLSIATLFMWLQNSGYRILIEQNISLEFLGFLGVGMAISSQIAGVVESIAMQYFHPIYYQEITNTNIESRKSAIEKLINKVLPVYVMLAIFLTFLAKYIAELLVDEKFYDAYVFIAFGIWVEFSRMTANLFGNISQSEMNTKRFMMPYIVGSLVTITLVYFASINHEYVLYLPLSLIIGGFTTMIVMYFSMKTLIDFSINIKLIYIAVIVSLPYASVYFLTIKTNLILNLIIVFAFGLYFLGTIYFIYNRGTKYDYY